MAHGDLDLGSGATPRSPFYDEGRFGRLFPSLPPFADNTAAVRRILTVLGAPLVHQGLVVLRLRRSLHRIDSRPGGLGPQDRRSLRLSPDRFSDRPDGPSR